MKLHPILLLFACLFIAGTLSAQNQQKYRIQLQSGVIEPAANISPSKIKELDRSLVRSRNRGVVLMQFENLPDAATRERLRKSGIEIQEYVSGNAFLTVVKSNMDVAALKQARVRSVVQLGPQQKMQPRLVRGDFPARARRGAGRVELWFSYSPAFSLEEVREELAKKGFEIAESKISSYRVLAVVVNDNRVSELAALPFVEYVQAAPGEDQALNDKSLVNSRGNILQSTGLGGRGLSGKDVVLGVGDDGTPLQHVDLFLRAYNNSFAATGAHGIHVMGTMTGAGIRDERYKGYAPQSKFVAHIFSNILLNTPGYITDYGMVLTNNSYGNVVDDCETFGVYDFYSRLVDQQMEQYPSLLHVFAAGNSGAINCGQYVNGFANVLGGYQSAKNAISVGNTWEYGDIATSSSKGPVKDGRIKPEITAQGTRVMSTVAGSNYGRNNGTSMAAPAVTGGLALLYERYKQLHGGVNPSSALMKALVCNGGTDLGNEGPDYTYGFGWMNLLRSVKMLENSNYYQATIAQGNTNTHSITIPAGKPYSQLKVMLYWHDPAASPLAAQSLQHDLDLRVQGPAGAAVYPYILDATPAQVTAQATRGIDRVNNIEQVVIANPQPGTYQFEVSGHRVTSASAQSYVVVYDTIVNENYLTYPVGGERFAGSDSLYISWDRNSTASGNLALEYSIDNGNTWEVISNSISATAKQYLWHIPAETATAVARVRLTQSGETYQSIGEPFTIVGTPTVTLAPVQCDTYFSVNWTSVNNASHYEVMISGGEEMRHVAFVNGNTYAIGGLNRDSNYHVSVRAWINGKPGRRAFAVSRTPNAGNCTGTISDRDLRLFAIAAPASGRMETSRQLTATTQVRITLRNIDDAFFGGSVPVGYRINDGTPVTANTPVLGLAPLGTYNFTFPVTADFSAPGVYKLQTWIAHPLDPVAGNDTAVIYIKQLSNPVIDLSVPYIENFDQSPKQSYTYRMMGLDGLDRFDFISSTVFGRIRTFLMSGMARSGERALTMDVDRYTSAGNVDSLTGTFNLKNNNAATDDIRLDFQVNHHGALPHAANRVWIRGSDQHPWLQLYDMDTNADEAGVYKKTTSLEISDLLQANGQNFSSSFQVKWGQWGRYNATDIKNAGGYTIDDVRIYKVTDDIQLSAIDSPLVASCGLGASTPVRVIVRNSANNTINSIPVSYRINGQSVITETIPSIPGNSSVTYTFSQTANMSALGSYQLETWVSLASDDFRENDTARTVLRNSPVINQFPYLQDFESGESYWFATGKNSSWEFGTPSSVKIRTAASGTHAWKTTLRGNYKDAEHSYLYSPCFDVSGMTTPMLSFSAALDMEDCGSSLCDGAWVEYSTDGLTWHMLGGFGEGMNWYNRNYPSGPLWSIQNYTNWHVASILLPSGHSNLRIRFVMKSDQYVSREGIAVDDIHIFDFSSRIYETASPASNRVEQNVNGGEWIEFRDQGELVAAVNPRQQNMGNTGAQVFLHPGEVRDTNQSYYLNRNLVVQPAQTRLADSVDIRFFFTDREVEKMLDAEDCTECPRVTSAYTLGVSQYTDAAKANENGTIDDNTGTNWRWIEPSKVRIVPYDSGYYAAFRVNRFSEFWLSNAPLGQSPAPSVDLTSFTAQKRDNNDVDVKWRIASEYNMDYYEVEVARGNDAYNQNNFEALVRTPSPGNTTTGTDNGFLDSEPGKTGVRYYRLKMVDIDGGVSYSAVRSIVFSNELAWQVYPNPTQGASWILFQSNEGEKIQVVVYDINGRKITQKEYTANGFVQKMELNLTSIAGPGLYLVDVRGSREKMVFKIVKQ